MPFKSNADRRHHIPKRRHQASNSATSDAALRRRGSLTIWFITEAVAAWMAESRTTRGGQPRYSGLAIATALMLRAVFRLALRQTEGLRACRVPRPPCRRRGGASVILNRMLGRFKTRGLVKARIKQRTDSTHVLAALDDLAAVVPDWLRICLLDALEGPIAPASARDLPMLQTLRDVCRVHHTRDEGRLRWRSVAELPAVTERMQSPHDPEAHFSMEQQPGWTGYKVHETRDDDAGHLITHVKTCPSMQLDIISTADIHGQLAAKKRPAAEYSVDFG